MQTITPWGEKYRPRKLKDIVHQSDIVKILKQNINSNNIFTSIITAANGIYF